MRANYTTINRLGCRSFFIIITGVSSHRDMPPPPGICFLSAGLRSPTTYNSRHPATKFRTLSLVRRMRFVVNLFATGRQSLYMCYSESGLSSTR